MGEGRKSLGMARSARKAKKRRRAGIGARLPSQKTRRSQDTGRKGGERRDFFRGEGNPLIFFEGG